MPEYHSLAPKMPELIHSYERPRSGAHPYTLHNRPIGLRSGITATLAVLAITLAGCGGSEGDGDIGFGSGQDPDPVVVDFPIAYVKRTLPVDENAEPVEQDARELIEFSAGADLFLRDRASPTAPETDITGEFTEGLGDVRDVEISFDGSKLLFAMREALDENLDEDEQPTWNIWQYDIELASLSRLISSDTIAEAGHDRSPAYLPDGRIVFSSTRQRQSGAILLDEGKPQFAALDENQNEPAFALHVMNEDGSDIHQITFNQSHDRDPSVLDNGQIVFSRWDNIGNNDGIALYQTRPDGTGTQLMYGANSHNTGTDGAQVHFLQPREMPNGEMLALVSPFVSNNYGGDLITIDTARFIENEQALAGSAGMPGPAQKAATVNVVNTETDPSPGGRYASAIALFDGTERLLVSWSQCRLQDVMGAIVPCTQSNLEDAALVPAPPLYGIWVYDRTTDTQLPVVEPTEGIMFTEVVAAQPRDLPAVLGDGSSGLDATLAEEGAGLIHIRSVYDIDGLDTAVPNIETLADPALTTATGRPARFIRISKAVSIPDDDIVNIPGTAFGRNRALGMREILAYAPIEPDGSVQLEVPANVAFQLSILDVLGRRISARHDNWLQVRPGEILQCNGCHDPNTGSSHGRDDAFDSVYAGSLQTSLPFPNTDPAIFADFGETMAQARARISCSVDNCASQTPSVNLQYEDVWTDELAAERPKDTPFSYSYGDLETEAPTTVACTSTWSSGCRVTINYEQHLHPLWVLPRVTLDVDGVTVLQDNTCSSCHGTIDAMGELQVPAAQLDLSDGVSDQNDDHFKSYRELMFGDNELEIIEGVLLDRLVEVGIDPETEEPILQTVGVAPSMNAAGALSNDRFFAPFAGGASHDGYLSAAEIKLINEWLDIGGQYFNNPFAVPVN